MLKFKIFIQITLAILFLLPSQFTIKSYAATKILSMPTNIESTSSRMISYRHQEHMWQTNDGAIHLTVNQGDMGDSNASLTLFSSFDNGQSWTEMLSFADSCDTSTSDGLLSNNELYLVYFSCEGDIIFIVLGYDNTKKSWEYLQEDIAFHSSSYLGINPTIALDIQGRIWCAFVDRLAGSYTSKIRIIQKSDEISGWQDTGLTIGAVTNTKEPNKSARLIALKKGIGMIYTSPERITWAYRANFWATDKPWAERLLFVHHEPYDKDPYASHFSVIDNQENIHIVATEKGHLVYIRYNSITKKWESAKYMTSDFDVTYVQATVALNKLFLIFNLYSNVGVLQSNDNGNSFSYAYRLEHPPIASNDENIDYSNPRLETPGKSGNVIPVVQQYVDDDIQKLIYFQITNNP